MRKQFDKKLVLITGAAQGIGAATARAFAQGGARLALVDRNAEGIERLAEKMRDRGVPALAYATDLRDRSAIDDMVARCEEDLGAIDVLASVAGVLHLSDILEMRDEDWEDTFAVNTTAVFRLCRAVARRMMRRQSGSIVITASNAARVPRMGMAAYACSKAATAHFARCLALELAPYGIRCNSVSPGSTDTAMQRQLWRSEDDERLAIRGTLDRFRLGVPLGRIATPEDIADLICFVASDQARHITMQDICIDGGATLGA